MKDEKQLVLFFSKGTKVDGPELAAKLSKKFEFLQDPIVLPFDSKNPQQPLIIFNRGIISLNVGIGDVSFIYNS